MNILKECINKNFILVLTGFSYIWDSSGTSKVVKAHEVIFNKNNIDYIVLYPIGNKYKRILGDNYYGIIINGKFIEVITDNELILLIKKLTENQKSFIGVLIHHLIFNSIKNIIKILKSFNNIQIIFYLHDFYTYCVNYKLLKNNKEFCFKNNIIECKNCKYEYENKKHKILINDFIDIFKNNIKFISPSEFTKNIWCQLFPNYAKKVVVLPHLIPQKIYKKSMPLLNNNQLKIAYIGAQIESKGWNIYKKIVEGTNSKKCNYKFYYFGFPNEKLDNVNNVLVQVHRQGKNAMIDSLRNENIDIVVLPAIWPETYSYTMYEAFAANSYILTLADSGNIAYTVKKNNIGKVFESEKEIYLYINNEEIVRKDLYFYLHNKKHSPLYYEDNYQILNLFDINKKIVVNCNLKRDSLYTRCITRILNITYLLKRTIKKGYGYD